MPKNKTGINDVPIKEYLPAYKTGLKQPIIGCLHKCVITVPDSTIYYKEVPVKNNPQPFYFLMTNRQLGEKLKSVMTLEVV